MHSNDRKPRRRAWIAVAPAATTAGLLAVTAAAYAGDSVSAVPAVAAPPSPTRTNAAQ